MKISSIIFAILLALAIFIKKPAAEINDCMEIIQKDDDYER